MEKLFALAIVIMFVAFAVVYTVAAVTGPSKLLKYRASILAGACDRGGRSCTWPPGGISYRYPIIATGALFQLNSGRTSPPRSTMQPQAPTNVGAPLGDSVTRGTPSGDRASKKSLARAWRKAPARLGYDQVHRRQQFSGCLL
jgi:hypothetical protein